jgi:hypothetical protein
VPKTGWHDNAAIDRERFPSMLTNGNAGIRTEGKS